MSFRYYIIFKNCLGSYFLEKSQQLFLFYSFVLLSCFLLVFSRRSLFFGTFLCGILPLSLVVFFFLCPARVSSSLFSVLGNKCCTTFAVRKENKNLHCALMLVVVVFVVTAVPTAAAVTAAVATTVC